MKIKPAGFILRWYLTRAGFWGITLPTGIYILEEHLCNERLIEHEKVHAAQYERYGVLGFFARYLYFNIKYGYKKNPLEVEAREKAGL